MHMIDLTGKRFGRLKVIRQAGHKGKRIGWECLCDCGSIKVVAGNSLTSNVTRSCGCLNAETARRTLTTHGHSGERLYNEWNCMRGRCNCVTNQDYKYYGGRGIRVCDEWNDDYLTYRTWALNHGYRDDLTIERIDVNENYCPSNCKWIPNNEQWKNTRRIQHA